MSTITRRKHGQKQKKERNIFMTKPGDSQTKKTLHELAKEFPEKTYRELERYRDADRQEEAQRIFTQQENEELKADQGKEIDYHRYWKKRAEEAEGELSIVKGIGNNSPEMKGLRSEVAALKQQLHTDRNEHQKNLDKIKKENNDLYNKFADLTEVAKSKDYFRDPDYKFLVNENHRLEQQYLEVMADNKKLALEIEDRVNQMRKSGM